MPTTPAGSAGSGWGLPADVKRGSQRCGAPSDGTGRMAGLGPSGVSQLLASPSSLVSVGPRWAELGPTSHCARLHPLQPEPAPCWGLLRAAPRSLPQGDQSRTRDPPRPWIPPLRVPGVGPPSPGPSEMELPWPEPPCVGWRPSQVGSRERCEGPWGHRLGPGRARGQEAGPPPGSGLRKLQSRDVYFW